MSINCTKITAPTPNTLNISIHPLHQVFGNQYCSTSKNFIPPVTIDNKIKYQY